MTNAPAFTATNYDRQIQVCYALGEYQSVASSNGSAYVGWGDDRNQITEPVDPLDPISGQTYPEQDVRAEGQGSIAVVRPTATVVGYAAAECETAESLVTCRSIGCGHQGAPPLPG